MTLQQDFQSLENWVVNLFATLKHDVQVAETDIIKVAQFLQAHSGQIATGIMGIIAVVGAAGVGVPLPIIAAAQAMAEASSVINQAVAAQQLAAAAGAGVGDQTVALLATGYQSLKTAQQHLAAGQAAITKPGS